MKSVLFYTVKWRQYLGEWTISILSVGCCFFNVAYK